ncbi:hypothetical protein ABKN59_009763 [Abortiporus biennis]
MRTLLAMSKRSLNLSLAASMVVIPMTEVEGMEATMVATPSLVTDALWRNSTERVLNLSGKWLLLLYL